MGYTLDQLKQLGATPGSTVAPDAAANAYRTMLNNVKTGNVYAATDTSQPSGSGIGGILKDAAQTLLVKPATRIGQAISAPFVKQNMDSTTNIQNQQTDQLQSVLDRMKVETDPVKHEALRQMAFNLVKEATPNTQAGQEATRENNSLSEDQNVNVGGTNFDIPGQQTGKAGFKQIAGDALKSASYLAAPEAFGAATAPEASLAEKALSGAKFGGAVGAAGGAGNALEDPNSGIGTIAKDTLEGAAFGAGTGAAIPAAIEGAKAVPKVLDSVGSKIENVVNNIGKKSIIEDSNQVALNSIKTDLSKTDQVEAATQGRAKVVKGKMTYLPSKEDTRMASTLQPMVEDGRVVDPKKPQEYVDNISNVQKEIEESVSNLRQGVRNTPGTWNQNELTKQVFATKAPMAIKATQGMEENLQNAVFNLISEASKTNEGLLNLRQNFDAMVKEEFPNMYDKDNTPIRQYIRNLRNSLNDFTEKQLPDGKLPNGTGFRDELRRQSNLINAREEMSAKLAQDVPENASKWQRFVRKNPETARILRRYGLGIVSSGLGLYTIGSALRKSITK